MKIVLLGVVALLAYMVVQLATASMVGLAVGTGVVIVMILLLLFAA